MPIGHSVRVGGDAGGTASKSGSTSGKKLDDTIECLLNLRSVRDQFRDAELHRTDEKLAQQLEELEDRLVDHLAEERELRDGGGRLTVAVVGDFNAGKSTFINALLGTNLCPVGEEPTTASVTHFIHGDKQRFELERDGARKSIGKGTYLSMVRHGKVGDRAANVFHVSVDSPVLDHIRLVDTPGFNAPPPNSNDTKVTEDAVAGADALFVIMDARKGNPSKTLLEQLDRMRNARRRNESDPPAFLLLNKAESIPPSQRSEVKSVCEKQYDERFRKVTPVSALRLNDADDTASLDGLEVVTRRIRGALARQESFETRISAMVVTNRAQPNYRVDIDGNVFEADVSLDGDLASREHLAVMVRAVDSERHALLKTRFERRTAQLRTDWLSVASAVDGLCKRAAHMSSGTGTGSDKRGHEALQEIDNAKRGILERVGRIFNDAVEEAVYTGQTEKPGFWSKTIYHIDLDLDKPHDEVRNDYGWDQVKQILTNLTHSLRGIAEAGTVPDSDKISANLKYRGVQIVRESLESDRKQFESDLKDRFEGSDACEIKGGACWRLAYEDEETLRDDQYDNVTRAYAADASRWTSLFTHDLQIVIDQLQAAIIRGEERDQAEGRERHDELTKLRQRIDEMKEHTP